MRTNPDDITGRLRLVVLIEATALAALWLGATVTFNESPSPAGLPGAAGAPPLVSPLEQDGVSLDLSSADPGNEIHPMPLPAPIPVPGPAGYTLR